MINENIIIAMPDISSVPEAYRDKIELLFAQWNKVFNRNRVLSSYANMHVALKELGISIPEKFMKVNTTVGWCKKAIDAYVVRSIFDGFAFAGMDDAALTALVKKNKMRSLYKQICRSSLTHGLSTVTVMRGTNSNPSVKVRAFSANQSAVLWDKDADAIGCGIVLADVDANNKPLRYIAHFADAVLVLSRVDYGQTKSLWNCEVLPNDLGRPMMEVIQFDADLDRPLGHSLLTPEVTGIVDKAMRDVFRMEVGSEFFTFPQRYALGVSDDLFSPPLDPNADPNAETAPPNDYMKFKAYIGAFLAISRDENGDIPQVGQFNPSQAQNFTHVFENDAQRFSGATNVPLAQLGVLSNTYTSSDALSASNDPLILAVESMNLANAEKLEEIARMMLAVESGTSIHSLTNEQFNVQAVFMDPALPTISARADAWTKIGAQDEKVIGSDVYYEGIGLRQNQIDRINNQANKNTAIAALNMIAEEMAADNGE